MGKPVSAAAVYVILNTHNLRLQVSILIYSRNSGFAGLIDYLFVEIHDVSMMDYSGVCSSASQAEPAAETQGLVERPSCSEEITSNLKGKTPEENGPGWEFNGTVDTDGRILESDGQSLEPYSRVPQPEDNISDSNGRNPECDCRTFQSDGRGSDVMTPVSDVRLSDVMTPVLDGRISDITTPASDGRVCDVTTPVSDGRSSDVMTSVSDGRVSDVMTPVSDGRRSDFKTEGKSMTSQSYSRTLESYCKTQESNVIILESEDTTLGNDCKILEPNGRTQELQKEIPELKTRASNSFSRKEEIKGMIPVLEPIIRRSSDSNRKRRDNQIIDSRGRMLDPEEQVLEALRQSEHEFLINYFNWDVLNSGNLKTLLQNNAGVAADLYTKGCVEVLRKLLEIGAVDATMLCETYLGRTGLQLACEGQHLELVDWLLDQGAQLQNVYLEESEFYQATIQGRWNVLAVLLRKRSNMVIEADARYCLLYAACKGGHLQLVKKWFTPGTNLMETTLYATNLLACEQRYPLFAACEGQFLDVATFLIMEGNACITREICQYFPEFTTKLVHALFLVSDSKGRLYFDLSDHKTQAVLACWFSLPHDCPTVPHDCPRVPHNCPTVPNDCPTVPNDCPTVPHDCPTVPHDWPREVESSEAFSWSPQPDKLVFEIVVDLHKNKIVELPEAVLWGLKELISLDVSYNPLQSIPAPLFSETLHLQGMKHLNLAHCQLRSVPLDIFCLPCLEELNLSHNQLTCLGTSDKETSGSPRLVIWKCSQLENLDVSHNSLCSLPSEIQSCARLTSLIASYNQLQGVCTPWQSPMSQLDLSHNQLTTFAPNAHMYWGRTLRKLNIQWNQYTALAETLVNMKYLSYLDASHNKIRQLPDPSLWHCPLTYLNLNENQLGTGADLHLPVASLAFTLMELHLANNGLRSVPTSISLLEKLIILDLSNNQKIRNLPLELGRLKNIYKMDLHGITVRDSELQKIISSLDVAEKCSRPVIHYLERKLKKCVSLNVLKLVVLGCQNKDGHCIVQGLVNLRNVTSSDHEKVTVTEMCSKQRKLKLVIWEMPNNKVSSTVLPCFLTLNSLYLIVHDVSLHGSDLSTVSEKVSCVQACLPCREILVVCTFSMYLMTEQQQKLERDILSQLETMFPKVKMCSVKLGSKEMASVLQQAVYAAWDTMMDAVQDTKVKVNQKQVPARFIEVADRAKCLRLDICSMDNFLRSVGAAREDLEDKVEQSVNLHNFLLQTGVMLSFDCQFGELGQFVVLNPRWLFDLLSRFLKSLRGSHQQKVAQLCLSAAREKFQAIFPTTDFDYFPVVVQVMETFNIGLRLADVCSSHQISFLVPSHLPKRPPQFQIEPRSNDCRTCRLYCLPFVPQALWSHLLSQLILAFERFSASLGHSDPDASSPDTPISHNSFQMKASSSDKGLNIHNKQIQYWRTGVLMFYEQGCVVVEEVECKGSSMLTQPGILITVQARTHQDTHTSTHTPARTHQDAALGADRGSRALSVLGIVRDELEEVLEMFHPKLSRLGQRQASQVYALCPLCHHVQPGSGVVSLLGVHFTVQDCAQELLSKDAIVCQRGPSSLHYLVPELMFMELPPEMCLSASDIIMLPVKLGQGMAGTVTKGTYKGTEVAVKVFLSSAERASTTETPNNLRYTNAADAALGVEKQQLETETEQFKITSAFSDVRREVGILSRLKHEFIVKFIGICVRPHLWLVMELAPEGSLRQELERRTQARDNCQPRLLSRLVFSKDLTFKIIYQITCGLSYLHDNNIIYRDLKPDNVLVMSLSPAVPVNVKLSDYGISKFSRLQGVTGLCGTFGYMAPEVVLKQAYTQKADIYSLAILMLELVTGLSPFSRLQLSDQFLLPDTQQVPPHIQGYTIHCNFPYMESLMKECWSKNMEDRPTANLLMKRMRSDQFLLLHDSLVLDENQPESLVITCIYACNTFGRWKIWICESGPKNHRFFSVYDQDSSVFAVQRREKRGLPVRQMVEVANKLWLICQEQNYLEVIERGNHSNFDVCRSASLESEATTLLYHCCRDSQGSSQSILCVGMKNGSVTVFSPSQSGEGQLAAVTTMTLNPEVGVADLCSLSCSLLAAACGPLVYFQQVAAPTCSGQLWRPEMVNRGSVSFKNLLGTNNSVKCFAAAENCLWCCLENSSYLAKIDVSTLLVVTVLTLSWDIIHDTAVLENALTPSKTSLRLVYSESDGYARASNRSSFNTDSRLSDSDNIFSHNESHEMSTQIGQRSLSRELATDVQEPVKLEQSSMNAHNLSQDTQDERPPLPPRTPNLTKRSCSVQDTSTHTPPPLPRRRTDRRVGLHVTSLLQSLDVLVAGTNSGGMLLLPLRLLTTCNTQSQDPWPSFQLPLMRHPATTKHTGTDPHVNDGFFRHEVTHQGIEPTGSITALSLADDKLISLHTARDSIPGSHNRTAMYPHAVEDSGTSSSSGLSSSSSDVSDPWTSDKTNGKSESLVSAVAVWHQASEVRLERVRSYSHQLSGCCTGWCCRSPTLKTAATVQDD